ncbi:MAG: spheroidene monooxygenase [Anaerolineae bacterium]|nr:spheroidene monooxygenase [Thermoflexales bacterium]MDW8396386.1 spheroidene monooxygenase [Anaerolineae bacterium]
MHTVVALTLMRFEGIHRLWMFSQMAFARLPLRFTSGLRFWKLLGAGYGGGFSLRPDTARFGLLTVWDTELEAQSFLRTSPVARAFFQRAAETWTVLLQPTRARGKWNGRQPFMPSAAPSSGEPIAVLTRATIRLSCLARFWSHVPAANRALADAEGVLFSIGIGELPFLRQATFSLWRSEADLRAYAHQSEAHARAIRCTYTERWYSEELFARFAVIHAEGSWEGRDPLGKKN